MVARSPSEAPLLRTAQIVLSALLVGVMTFAIVAVFARPQLGEPDEELGKKLLLVLAGLAFLQLPVYALVRKRSVRLLSRRFQDARAEIRKGRIPRELMGLSVIGGAMAEGLGIFGTTAFLVSGQWLALIAPALAIILIGVQIPGRESIERLVRQSREHA